MPIFTVRGSSEIKVMGTIIDLACCFFWLLGKSNQTYGYGVINI